ncbi:serine protease inhibitor Cvsi-1-like [Ruditapes philippinarum]|uniref:serine protease inhibitor Cvsi-1-like n=1 Tax=Ruditapes philippinarum TaxID=129788 RepID=UPI00295AED39|nr:serine protease inhibitor Cvsi-1-like [Ruditapes philippinarum]
MRSSLFLLFISASVLVTVFSEKCNHGDSTGCSNQCTNANEVVGCEHDTCTCVPTPQACILGADCAGLGTCPKHDESYHCVDGACKCQKP